MTCHVLCFIVRQTQKCYSFIALCGFLFFIMMLCTQVLDVLSKFMNFSYNTIMDM